MCVIIIPVRYIVDRGRTMFNFAAWLLIAAGLAFYPVAGCIRRIIAAAKRIIMLGFFLTRHFATTGTLFPVIIGIICPTPGMGMWRHDRIRSRYIDIPQVPTQVAGRIPFVVVDVVFCLRLLAADAFAEVAVYAWLKGVAVGGVVLDFLAAFYGAVMPVETFVLGPICLPGMFMELSNVATGIAGRVRCIVIDVNAPRDLPAADTFLPVASSVVFPLVFVIVFLAFIVTLYTRVIVIALFICTQFRTELMVFIVFGLWAVLAFIPVLVISIISNPLMDMNDIPHIPARIAFGIRVVAILVSI